MQTTSSPPSLAFVKGRLETDGALDTQNSAEAERSARAFAGGLSIIIGGGIIVGSALHHIEDRKPKERRFCAVCGWVLLEPSGFCENCAKRKLTSAAGTTSSQ